MFKTVKSIYPYLLPALAFIFLAYQLGLALVNYSRLASASLAFPFPIDYGEGPLLDQTLRLAAGENIYKNDFSVPPYTISNYPPLFLLIQLPFALAVGPAMWYGRLISLVAAVLTALFIGLTLKALTGSRVGAVVGGLMFLAIPYVQYWSLLNRIDLLALALSWAAMFVIARFSERRWGILLAAGLLVAAVYTRQSYALAAPLAGFTALLAARRFRKALTLAAVTGGAGLALFLILNLVTRGGFYLNIVRANVNPFYWDTVEHHFEQLYENAFPLIFVTGAFLVFALAFGMMRSWPLVTAYAVAAFATGVTIGKDGSNVNYLLELSAALALGAGALTALVARRPWLLAAAALVLAYQVTLLGGWSREDFNHRILDRTAKYDEAARLAQAVREADGIVLADEYMGLLPLVGKRIYFQPFEYKMLQSVGVWDEGPFLAELRSREFALVLWYQPPYWPAIESRWTTAMINTIRRNYSGSQVYDFTRVLLPLR